MRTPRSLLAASIALVALPGGDVTGAGDDAALDEARAGLAAYLVDNRPTSPSESREVAGCPAIDLARFESALDDAGITADPLGDWGTEIEWSEWAEIHPELMGIVCAGDADGDANDTDTLFGAGIAVIDAGSEEQAIEVEQQIGFGALDAEPADVPGGEVMARCLDDAGLSLCMTVWSHDGFVLAVVLRSDEQEIPDATGTAVLEDVLDDVLATLADYSGPGTPAASPPSTADTVAEPSIPDPSGPLDVPAALAGLSSLLDRTSPVGELEGGVSCPVTDASAVGDALATAGVDSPPESFEMSDGPTLGDGTTWSGRGLVCEGAYVGSDDDPSFPETLVSLVVAEVGDDAAFRDFIDVVDGGVTGSEALPTPTIGGATMGQCGEIDRVHQCVEYWILDGLAVAVNIEDRVFVDRPTASAFLVAIVPDIVGGLIATPVEDVGSGVTVPGDVLDAARVELAALASGPGAVECPYIDRPAIDAALDDAGIDLVTDDWSAVTSEGAAGAVAALACSGRAGRGEVRVDVFDFAESDAAEDIIELVHGCQRVGDTEYCVESWEQDGLTVTVGVTATGSDVAQADVRALADALAPLVVGRLAG